MMVVLYTYHQMLCAQPFAVKVIGNPGPCDQIIHPFLNLSAPGPSRTPVDIQDLPGKLSRQSISQKDWS